jgi:aryl-alcohol dehydrogenase-like predicted oxidoreductase
MEKRLIGNSSLQIAPLNFGGNVLGWTLNEQQSYDILDAFTGAGFNFIDTADTYSWWVEGHTGGESETVLGNWMKKKNNRKDLVIATKVGSENRTHPIDISRAHILKSADESLRRLQTDYIDLYYTHFDDPKIPVAETLSAYQELIKAGKVRFIAASNLSPERLKESMEASEKEGLPRYQALQPHYNLVERNAFESEYAPLAEKYGLSVFPYWALAAGFLTGKYRSESDLTKSVRGEGARKYLNEKGFTVLKALDTVATRYSVAPATVSLAWLLAQPLVAAPIVSATSQQQLETLLAAPKLKLDAEDLQLLNQASA